MRAVVPVSEDCGRVFLDPDVWRALGDLDPTRFGTYLRSFALVYSSTRPVFAPPHHLEDYMFYRIHSRSTPFFAIDDAVFRC
jgi:hypothetical protein